MRALSRASKPFRCHPNTNRRMYRFASSGTGPRRQHTIEEKRRIVEETHVKGASVATVAPRDDLNANQVFDWRQLYRQGLLDANAAKSRFDTKALARVIDLLVRR